MNATTKMRTTWSSRTRTSTPCESKDRINYYLENMGPGRRSQVVLLVRFGELALKSRFVRRQLRDRLVANIQDLFAAEGVECITEADEARVYVHVNDVAKARTILGRVFGVVSISPATEVHSDLDSLRKAVLSEASPASPPGQSFALRRRRVGTHPFTSQDLGRELGEAVRQVHPDVRVNLTQPDVEIHVEVRRNRGFFFQAEDGIRDLTVTGVQTCALPI